MAIGSDPACVLSNQSHDEVAKDHRIRLESNLIIIIIMIMTSKDLCGGVTGMQGLHFKSTL